MLLAYVLVAGLLKLVGGCTYVSVPGRFTLIDTKDNSVKLDQAAYDPNAHGVTVKGFELQNKASPVIEQTFIGLNNLAAQLNLLAGRLVELQTAAPTTASSQPARDDRLDHLLALLEKLVTDR